MKRSVILKTLIFLVSALLIFYFSIIQAQAKSVTMRMLIWKGYAPKNLQSQFIKIVKAKHGINVKFDIKFCKGNDAFYGALRANKADLISPSINVPKGNRFKLIKRNLVMPLDLNMVPNYKNILPSLKKADYCTENDIVYAVPHIRGSYGLAYNTNLIKTAPTSWNILWDPKYKRRYTIGGPDQYMHNVSLVALAHGISAENIYDFNKLNTAALKKKVDYLAMNAKSMWVGVDDAKTLKGLHLAVVWSFSLPELRKKGEVWKIAEPKEGTTGWVDNFMINNHVKKDALKTTVAYEWLNFILSDDYQVYNIRGLASAPVTTTVNAKLTANEIKQFHLDDPSHFGKNRILWRPLSLRNRNGLKKLWDDAMKKRK